MDVYLCHSASNGTSIPIKVFHLINVGVGFIEIGFALVQQRLLLVTQRRWPLNRRFSKKSLDCTRCDMAMQRTRIEEVLSHIRERVGATHDVVEPLRKGRESVGI